MSSKQGKVKLLGSARHLIPGSKRIEAVDPKKHIEVTVVVRRASSSRAGDIAREIGNKMPKERIHLRREEFAQAHGASHRDLEEIKKFAQAHQLEVIESSTSKRAVKLGGSIESFSKAFDVKLARFDSPRGEYRGREGEIYVPKEISDIVISVHGLDDRKQLFPHYRRASTDGEAPHSFDPPKVASLYDFPTNFDGSGQCIGILEFGGGYDDGNLNKYFNKLGINPLHITSVSIDGATNIPNIDPGSDGEVQLDIEVAGAIAHGAQLVVYFAPNSDQGFVDAITSAIHDSTNNPSVISISWGGDESTWSDQTANSMNQAFEDAASLGITFCVATGDHGSSDYWPLNQNQLMQCENNPTMDCAKPPDGQEHVDFPASSPYVLACGGTSLIASNGTINKEVVWNNNNGWATGGGISVKYALPDYQKLFVTNKHGRGVPDISGNADGQTGYNVSIDGVDTDDNGNPLSIGGTSAVAPLWAALVGILNQGLNTHIGFINPLLYTKASNAFHDITSGNNDTVGRGNYTAGTGWDACTGLGSPDGKKILSALSS